MDIKRVHVIFLCHWCHLFIQVDVDASRRKKERTRARFQFLSRVQK